MNRILTAIILSLFVVTGYITYLVHERQSELQKFTRYTDSWSMSQMQPRPHSDALMKVLDGINHSGLGKVWFAGRGIAPDWQMKREMLSPAYTTRWKELPVARF